MQEYPNIFIKIEFMKAKNLIISLIKKKNWSLFKDFLVVPDGLRCGYLHFENLPDP